MLKNNITFLLEERKLLKEIINKDLFDKNFLENKISFYIGIDPTSDSLHLGHYSLFNVLRIFNTYNPKIIFVLGGFTAMIGDPSGKSSERISLSNEFIESNIFLLEKQINHLCFLFGIKNYEIFNNIEIYNKLSIVELYQMFGKHFNINTMLSREMVQNRISTGISYTEFSYQMFQAIDYFFLNKQKNVNLQIGGSDQFGNIVSGIELIRKLTSKEVCGITTNLITKENGQKLGKTDSGSIIWLNKEKTSAYTFLQYLLNLDDKTTIDLLFKLTLIEIDLISKNIEWHKEFPNKKLLQNLLASNIITILFGKEEYENAVKVSEKIFMEKFSEIDSNTIKELLSGLPYLLKTSLKEYEDNFSNKLLRELIMESKILSRKEFEDYLKQGAIKINGIKIEKNDISLKEINFLHLTTAIISIGKKNKYLIFIGEK